MVCEGLEGFVSRLLRTLRKGEALSRLFHVRDTRGLHEFFNSILSFGGYRGILAGCRSIHDLSSSLSLGNNNIRKGGIRWVWVAHC